MAKDTIIASPWNELDFYKEGQPLYGRDEEIWKVTNGICQNLQTIVYGQSGIGKSSLLFAGVFPQLRKEKYFPVFIRLGIPSDKPYNDRVIEEISREAERIDTSIGKDKILLEKTIHLDQPQDKEKDATWDLWNFLSTTRFVDQQSQDYIPVMVFDQFEEILNNTETHKKAEQFLLDIYSLIDDTRISPDGCIPYSNFRVVFSIREDYLYCLEDIIDKHNLNELRYNRYRIAAMSDRSAKEVILRTSNDIGGCLEKGKEDLICNKIIQEAKNNNYLGEVSTLMLSLICSTQYYNATDGIIKYHSLSKSTDFLYNYYSSKMSVVEYSTQDYLEEKLITSDGRRSSMDLRDALESGKVSLDAIQTLAKTRIIRLVSSGGNSQRIEFIHDTLTKVIKKNKKTLWKSFVHVCKNVNNFGGHADRKEWIASFLPIAIAFSAVYLHKSIFGQIGRVYELIYYYIGVFGALICFPTSVRRCHDMGRSGWRLPLSLFVLPFLPSSPRIFQSTASGITWRRIFIRKSLNHNEYQVLSARLFMFGIWMCLLILPLFLLTDEPARSSYTIMVYLAWVFTVLIPLVNGYFLLFLMRFSSTNIPLFAAFIPGFNLFFMIRLFWPYKNSSIKDIKSMRLLLFSIIFFPVWLLALLFLF